MENKNFNNLLLTTAFACMACDGDIDKREVDLIRDLHLKEKTFGEIDINHELDKLLHEINAEGFNFIKDYFAELSKTSLNEEDELKLIEAAIATIKADEKVEYSEIKFFKVIRSKLKIDNEKILERHPDFEDYIEEDIITDKYLARLQDDYLKTYTKNEFSLIDETDGINLVERIEKND